MKTKEMRVGNYYINKEDGQLYKIQASDMISLNYIEENDDSYIPIPLTKEVFFILTYGIYNCVICNRDVKLDIHNTRFIFTPDRFGIYSYEAVSYLHQLQNLYYTMTGRELPIDFDKLKEYVKTIEL